MSIGFIYIDLSRECILKPYIHLHQSGVMQRDILCRLIMEGRYSMGYTWEVHSRAQAASLFIASSSSTNILH